MPNATSGGCSVWTGLLPRVAVSLFVLIWAVAALSYSALGIVDSLTSPTPSTTEAAMPLSSLVAHAATCLLTLPVLAATLLIWLRPTTIGSWVLLCSTGLLIAGFAANASLLLTLHGALCVILLVVFRRKLGILAHTRLSTPQVFGIGSVGFAMLYGTVGSYLLRSSFTGLTTWTDALYFTFITYSTLGYGDVLPVTSGAKLFTISMIVVGLSSFVTALTVLVGPVLDKKLKGVFQMMAEFYSDSGHTVLCGWSQVSAAVARALQAASKKYVIIAMHKDEENAIEQAGHDAIIGDPTTDVSLKQANIQKATALIAASDNDAQNIMIALAATGLRQKFGEHPLTILVLISDPENAQKARLAGADAVVSPALLAGQAIVQELRLEAESTIEVPDADG